MQERPVKEATELSERFGDPVEKTGCQAQSDAILLCFDQHRDWRKCKSEIEAFRKCYEDFDKNRAAETMAELTRIIDETVEGIFVKAKEDNRQFEAEVASKLREFDELDPTSTIPFSTEE